MDTKLIFLGTSGSKLYGTNVAESDDDTRGVCFNPIETVLGLNRFEQYEDRASDTVIFGINKFVRLAIDCNPNILELFFIPDEKIKITTPAWQSLSAYKPSFINKRDVHAKFRGYAYSEFQKIKRAKDAGKEIDFKNGMHTLRLLDQGIELLTTGMITFPRPNASFLKDVRNGEYSFDEIMSLAELTFNKFDSALEQSVLPDTGNFNTINKWLIAYNFRYVSGAFDNNNYLTIKV